MHCIHTDLGTPTDIYIRITVIWGAQVWRDLPSFLKINNASSVTNLPFCKIYLLTYSDTYLKKMSLPEGTFNNKRLIRIVLSSWSLTPVAIMLHRKMTYYLKWPLQINRPFGFLHPFLNKDVEPKIARLLSVLLMTS